MLKRTNRFILKEVEADTKESRNCEHPSGIKINRLVCKSGVPSTYFILIPCFREEIIVRSSVEDFKFLVVVNSTAWWVKLCGGALDCAINQGVN